LQELFIGDANYVLVRIPPMVWNGVKGIGQAPAMIANCATHPHDPAEISRLDPFSPEIPYDWPLRHGSVSPAPSVTPSLSGRPSPGWPPPGTASAATRTSPRRSSS